MVERYDGEQLPPVHPQGPPPVPDGDRVTAPPPLPAPPVTVSERLAAVVLVLIVLAAIVFGLNR